MSTLATHLKKIELRALTGIRGLASIGVFLAHINAGLENLVHAKKYLFAQPYVDFFFILSGFVISYVYMSKASWNKEFLHKFYVARFARIYPLYIFSMLVAGALIAIRFYALPGLNAVSIIKQLVLVSALPEIGLKHFLVFTSWSVSIEWWLYILLFPILFSIVKYRKYLASPLIIVGIMALLAIYMDRLPEGGQFTRDWPAWIRGVAGFTVGWLLHHHHANNTWFAQICKKYCTLFFTLWIVIILALPQYTGIQPWWALIVSPFLLLGLCYDDATAASKLFSAKLAVYLGDVSYSIYLLHPLVLIVLKKIFNKVHLAPTAEGLIYASVAIVVTLTISHITYSYLEKPMRGWLQLKLNKKVNLKTAVGSAV